MSLFCVKSVAKIKKKNKNIVKINRGEFDGNSDFNQQKRWKKSKLEKQKHQVVFNIASAHTLHFHSSSPSLLSAFRNGQWILEDLKNFGFFYFPKLRIFHFPNLRIFSPKLRIFSFSKTSHFSFSKTSNFFIFRNFGFFHFPNLRIFSFSKTSDYSNFNTNQNDAVPAHKQLRNEPVACHRFGFLLAFALLRHLSPHFLDILQHHVAVAGERKFHFYLKIGKETGQKL